VSSTPVAKSTSGGSQHEGETTMSIAMRPIELAAVTLIASGLGCRNYVTEVTVRDPGQVEIANKHVRLPAGRGPMQRELTVETLHPSPLAQASSSVSLTEESASLERAADGSIAFICGGCSGNSYRVLVDTKGRLRTADQRRFVREGPEYGAVLTIGTGGVVGTYGTGPTKTLYVAHATVSFLASTPWTNLKEVHRRSDAEPATAAVALVGAAIFIGAGAAMIVVGPDKNKYTPGTDAYDRSRAALNILGAVMIVGGAVFGWWGWQFTYSKDELLYRAAEN
jgi:hypothetical protein